MPQAFAIGLGGTFEILSIGTLDPLFDDGSPNIIVIPDVVGRDADIIDDVIDRLTSTGQFAGVYWGELPELRGRPAELLAMATVEPASWNETDEFDDEFDYQSVVKGTFLLTLFTRDKDPRTRDRILDLLRTAAANAINEQSLAGITIPGLTILRNGKYLPANNPERRMSIVGEYAYFVNGPTGHDTTV